MVKDRVEDLKMPVQARTGRRRDTAIIIDALQWLPEETYTDADLTERAMQVYQHVYTAYPGGVRA